MVVDMPEKRLQLFWKVLLILMFLVCLAGFILLSLSVGGVPAYEDGSKKYLLKRNYPQDVVDALLEYKPIKPDMVAQLMEVPSRSVRHMLARNPNLTFADRQTMWRDKDEYVREGLAMNLRLSHGEMLMAIREQPDQVLFGLAMNPAAPREILLQVRQKFRERDYNASWYIAFVQNPNCPQEIIDEITKGSNDSAHYFLRLTQENKENIRQAKAKGEPFSPNEGYYWGQTHLWWRDEDE